VGHRERKRERKHLEGQGTGGGRCVERGRTEEAVKGRTENWWSRVGKSSTDKHYA